LVVLFELISLSISVEKESSQNGLCFSNKLKSALKLL